MGKQLRESDPCFKTHQSYYEQVKPLVDVMLIENVPEYKPCVIQKELGPEWQMESAVVDPRVFGVAASRSRLYAICWKTETVTWRADVKMKEVIDLLTSSVVAEAGTFYWKDLPKSKLTESQVFRPNLEIKDIRISWFFVLGGRDASYMTKKSRNLRQDGSARHQQRLDFACVPLHQERVLADYTKLTSLRYCDLSQYPSNGRARGECLDGTLPTLTTNSSNIYSQDQDYRVHTGIIGLICPDLCLIQFSSLCPALSCLVLSTSILTAYHL